jgi:hypothetical protein
MADSRFTEFFAPIYKFFDVKNSNQANLGKEVHASLTEIFNQLKSLDLPTTLLSVNKWYESIINLTSEDKLLDSKKSINKVMNLIENIALSVGSEAWSWSWAQSVTEIQKDQIDNKAKEINDIYWEFGKKSAIDDTLKAANLLIDLLKIFPHKAPALAPAPKLSIHLQ